MPNYNNFYTNGKIVPVGIQKTTTGCQLLTLGLSTSSLIITLIPPVYLATRL